jgi:hypothetical protein
MCEQVQSQPEILLIQVPKWLNKQHDKNKMIWGVVTPKQPDRPEQLQPASSDKEKEKASFLCCAYLTGSQHPTTKKFTDTSTFLDDASSRTSSFQIRN